MAWFGDGLSSLSNLKGQITSFTKDVLSDGIVEETDERTRQLNEANEKCVQLQQVLDSKDAEISLLRRQNCELQKAVVELNAQSRESNDPNCMDDEGGGGFFWDPPPIKNRDSINNSERSSILQDQLSQTSLRIRELEEELKFFRNCHSCEKNDEITDNNHQKAEIMRAKQDLVNRIIQIGEKNRDSDRNIKKSLDESVLINDFRAAISKLESNEQKRMIKSALKAIDAQRDSRLSNENIEKSDDDEKDEKHSENRQRLESISLADLELKSQNGITENAGNSKGNKEIELLRKEICELRKENEFLSTNIEELDRQHAQSLDTVLGMKDQLNKKHESLQKAYELLYVECNEAQRNLEILENKSSAKIEANNNNISEKADISCVADERNEEKQVQTDELIVERQEKKLQTMEINNEEKFVQTETEMTCFSQENRQDCLENATRRVKDILKNCYIEIGENETIFESLAKQYVESNWKKEMLERKVTEISRELNESIETKESLQMECDDMQTNIESLLLQIEHLKSNLPSIPEASEERVASLETETESMSEEIKRLQTEYEALRVKHFEEITTISALEGSLRNQENLEAEVRNTKQQLNLAKQQLDGASKNVENNENLMEDLSRRLHVSLEENNELRKKIEALEIAEKLMEQDIRVSRDKIENYEKNEEIIKELRKQLEILTKELNETRICAKKLEKDVEIALDSKEELERDIRAICNEKESLEAEIFVLRDGDNKNNDSQLLTQLREELETVYRDKDDLEYDILNMRKELDLALEQITLMDTKTTKLSFENERLIKENNELLEQLSSANDDSVERIELLQTEMNLLTQEYSSLKQESSFDKTKLEKIRKKLEESETQLRETQVELSANIKETEILKTNQSIELTNHQEKIVEYEKEIINLRSLEKDYRDKKELCEFLQAENREKDENMKFMKECQEEKIRENERKFKEFEEEIENLKTELIDIKASRMENDKIIAELRENRKNLETLLENAKENAKETQETIDKLSQLIINKDEEIETLKSSKETIKICEEQNESQVSALKNEREEMVRLIQEKHVTNLHYYAEIQRLAQLLADQTSIYQQTIAERDEKCKKLSEKDAELLWAQNELQVVRKRLKTLEESQNFSEICNVVEHSTQIAQATILNEKCNALEAALIKEQSSNRIIQNQLIESQQRENNAAKELERLRSHLVDMEASYTEEALIAEENRQILEAKLHQAEEKAQNSSTVYTSASIRANQQVETLQQQMALIIQQRDEIQNKLSSAEDKVLSHTASLTNLQIVLEQFQREKENDIHAATEKIRQQLNMSYKDQENLRNEIVGLRTQLSEAKECLQAASRLSEQLDKKSERIEELNQEVTRLTELVNTADERIEEVTKNDEEKVDKNLVKNLLLGFLSSSTTDKSSVLRVFATILQFDENEREKAGLNNPSAANGWFTGLLGSGATPTKDQEASLSAAFVRFLESESKPKPQLPALTISSNSSLSRPGHSRQHSSSSTQSGLLLSSITLPSFPDFVPSRNTGSILKEILKDS